MRVTAYAVQAIRAAAMSENSLPIGSYDTVQASESGPNVKMEKPQEHHRTKKTPNGGYDTPRVSMASHASFHFSEFLAARPLVGIGSKGISARKWVVAATRDARHIHGTAVARLANIRKR